MDKDCTQCIHYDKRFDYVVLPANCGTQFQDVMYCTLKDKEIRCKYRDVCSDYKKSNKE